MEHTLQKQLLAQNQQIANLTALVQTMVQSQQQLVSTTATSASSVLPNAVTGPQINMITNNLNAVQTFNGPVTNINTQINIRSWYGEDRLFITIAMLRAAFTENPDLVKYCCMSDQEKVDAEKAAPYVVETLMDLVKRAHTDPSSRNVYLNPKRADQVMVLDETSWKVVTLVEAIKTLCDTVADKIRGITTGRDCQQLPLEVRAAAAWVPSLYQDEADAYVEKVRARMSAHLTNITPSSVKAIAAEVSPPDTQ